MYSTARGTVHNPAKQVAKVIVGLPWTTAISLRVLRFRDQGCTYFKWPPDTGAAE